MGEFRTIIWFVKNSNKFWFVIRDNEIDTSIIQWPQIIFRCADG